MSTAILKVLIIIYLALDRVVLGVFSERHLLNLYLSKVVWKQVVIFVCYCWFVSFFRLYCVKNKLFCIFYFCWNYLTSSSNSTQPVPTKGWCQVNSVIFKSSNSARGSFIFYINSTDSSTNCWDSTVQSTYSHISHIVGEPRIL